MKDTHDMQTENSDLTDIIHLLLERKLVQSAPQLVASPFRMRKVMLHVLSNC